jgi:hypothetical protein
VVDPRFGDRVAELLERMPVWIADTEANHATAARARTALDQAQTGNHVAIGALTTFMIDMIDSDSTPEAWCLEILDTVAGHHDRYSHHPATRQWRSTARIRPRRCCPPWQNTALRTSQLSQMDFARVRQMASQPDRQTIRSARADHQRVIGRRFW